MTDNLQLVSVATMALKHLTLYILPLIGQFYIKWYFAHLTRADVSLR